MRLTLLWQSFTCSSFCFCQPETMTMAVCLLYLHRCRAVVLLLHQWIPELECCFYPCSSCLAIDWVKGDPLWSNLFSPLLTPHLSFLFLLLLLLLLLSPSLILKVVSPNQKVLTTKPLSYHSFLSLPLLFSPLGFCRCFGSKSWKGLLQIADSLHNFISIQWKEWVHGW